MIMSAQKKAVDPCSFRHGIFSPFCLVDSGRKIPCLCFLGVTHSFLPTLRCNTMPIDAEILKWLLEGDPAIRWQVQRDLLDAPAEVVAAERGRVAEEGWGRRLLALRTQMECGAAGCISPKWISTTYTLLALRTLGLPAGNPQALGGCALLLEHGLLPGRRHQLRQIVQAQRDLHHRHGALHPGPLPLS